MRLAILEHGSVSFHPNLLKRLLFSFGSIGLHGSRSFAASVLSDFRRFFFGSLSGNHDRRPHSRDLLIAMDLGHDVVDDIVESIIEDLVCLQQVSLCP